MRPSLGALLCALALSCPAASASDGIALAFRKRPGLPSIAGLPTKGIDAEKLNTLIFRMRADREGTARLRWISSADPRVDDAKSLWFFFHKSDAPREYVFNVRSQNPLWRGLVPGIMIWPDDGPLGVEVESGRAVARGLLSDIRSGWQEFWGPNGRLVVGSTINTIKSSNLFGRPIFVYLYGLIGLVIAGSLAWSSRAKSGAAPPPGRIAVGTILFLWLLLEVSSYHNDWLQVVEDWRFFGRSREETLIAANTPDFYPFIEFCEKNIPPGAGFSMRIPAYNDIKARYYLYPRRVETDAEYLVVYQNVLEPPLAKRYVAFKSFRGDAYILKRKPG